MAGILGPRPASVCSVGAAEGEALLQCDDLVYDLVDVELLLEESLGSIVRAIRE